MEAWKKAFFFPPALGIRTCRLGTVPSGPKENFTHYQDTERPKVNSLDFEFPRSKA